MAIVGDAYIVVRALTDKVESDIRRGFSGVEGAGRQAGESMADAFNRGFKRKSDANIFTRFSDALSTMVPEAEKARLAWAKLTRTMYTAGPAVSQLIGAISGVIGGLGALVGSAAAAASSIVVLGNVFGSAILGMISAKLALGGVGKALGALNKAAGGGSALAANAQRIADAEKNLALVIERNRENLVDANNSVRDAQLALNEAIRQGREEIQQIGFEAESAALDEKQAAIQLGKAREALARVQDLPPNSRARQEAELAYQQAELQLRMAKDRSADLNAEQDRLARTGVAGTSAVIDATRQLEEAELNKNKVVRDGIRAQEDAQKALEDAKNAAATAGGGGGDPFAGLTDSQKEFVKFLYSLKPLYAELRETASSAFLPPLQEAIDLLATKAFPAINQGIGLVAGAMGRAAVSIAQAVTSGEALKDLSTFFVSSSIILERLGKTLGSLWGSATSLLAAASPLAIQFVSFLESKANAFNNFLNVKQATGELQGFFRRVSDIASDFGKVFGNIFKGIGKIISANFKPGSGGDMLLQWLKTATDKFANLDKTVGGQGNLVKYFQDVASNTQKIMSSVGALIKELTALGANKSIGETFDILAKGAPYVGLIATKLAEAGPALAEFVVEALKLIEVFTDSESPRIYWQTITEALKLVTSLLDSEVGRALLTVISQIGAIALAFGTIYKTGKFVFEAIVGSLALVSKGIGTAVGAFKTLETALFGNGVAATTARGQILGMGKSIGKAVGWAAVIGGVAGAISSIGDRGEIAAESVDSIDKAIKGITTGGLSAEWDKIAKSVQGADAELGAMGENLQWITSGAGKFDKAAAAALDSITFGLFDFSKGYKAADGTLAAISKTLQSLASTNLAAAARGFREVAATTDGSTESLTNLLNGMPEYRAELEKLAEANGLAVTDQNLLNLAQGEGYTATRIIKEAFNESAAASLDTTGKVQGLADAVRNYNSQVAETQNTAINYQQALDDLTIALQNNGLSFDITEQAGRDNSRALQELASASNEAATAAYEQDGDVAKLTSTLQANREEMINQMVQSGLTQEAASALVDQYMMTPEQITTKVKTEGIPESKAEIEDLYDKAQDKTATITVNPKKGVGWDTIIAKFQAGDIWGALTTPFWANGGLIKYANGGFASYANGGMNVSGTGSTGIYNGRAGGLYKFAEPETGWEAFISGKSGQESRNIKIWEEAGRRLGVLGGENQAEAGMNALKKTSIGVQQSVNPITINVHPSPGMDEQALAQAVSRQLAFEMRKGSVY